MRLAPGWAPRGPRTYLWELLTEDSLLARGVLSQKAWLGASWAESAPAWAVEEGLLKEQLLTGDDRGLADTWAALQTSQIFHFFTLVTTPKPKPHHPLPRWQKQPPPGSICSYLGPHPNPYPNPQSRLHRAAKWVL